MRVMAPPAPRTTTMTASRQMAATVRPPTLKLRLQRLVSWLVMPRLEQLPLLREPCEVVRRFQRRPQQPPAQAVHLLLLPLVLLIIHTLALHPPGRLSLAAAAAAVAAAGVPDVVAIVVCCG